MSVVCGSIFLVSCSNGYKKMYLQVEYAQYDADGKFLGWQEIENGRFDFIMSSNLYDKENEAYLFNVRVKVKGTSKKVSSLYVSQTANNSTVLKTNNVKPNEAFSILVKNVGSVSFTITPSNGGEDKAVKFGMNIYRELEKIEQDSGCVPAMVLGGYVNMDKLPNLIKYYPFNDLTQSTETNRTGVDYMIAGVGRLKDEGQSSLIDREFVQDLNYTVSDDGMRLRNRDLTDRIWFQQTPAGLSLHVDSRYELTQDNNVIKLTAISKHDEEKTADVYVYIVENFKESSLLVSYKDDIRLQANGDLPLENLGEVDTGKPITIYDARIGSPYRAINIYTYTSRSIYSFVSQPGITLNVYINGQKYNYKEITETDLGVKITPAQITDSTNPNYTNKNVMGIKIEPNPLKNDGLITNQYDIKLEVDFTAFDFSASDTAPIDNLKKEFTVRVDSLANSFAINDKSYDDNLGKAELGERITYYQSNDEAKLYSYYAQDALGMPLKVQAVPINAENVEVGVKFYSSLTKVGTVLTGQELKDDIIRLKESKAFNIYYNENYYSENDGAFVIGRRTGSGLLYLSFNPLAKIDDIDTVYAVFKVQSTPDEFNGEAVDKKYITFIAKLDVLGAAEDVQLLKDSATDQQLDDTYLQHNLPGGQASYAYIDLKSNAMDIDLDKIQITSAEGKVKFSANNDKYYSSMTVEQLTQSNGRYRLYFRSSEQCKDSIIIQAPNGLYFEREFTFVNVTSTDNVTLDYDKSFVWTSATETEVEYRHSAEENYKVDLKYLALQSGKTAQFTAKGDDKASNIAKVTAKKIFVNSVEYSKLYFEDTSGGTPKFERLYPSDNMLSFSSTAINLPSANDYYWFDVQANTIGATAVLLVKVDFYILDSGVIKPASKYFLYEIATYTPARDLNVIADRDSLLYINDNYNEVAKITFDIRNNSTSATKQITFSNSSVNDFVNTGYGSDIKNIYGIEVNLQPAFDMLEGLASEGQTGEDVFYTYFEVAGANVDGGKLFVGPYRKLTLTAITSLQPLQSAGINSIYFDFSIHQLGQKSQVHTYRRVVYFGDYTKAEGIVVDGIDRYSNLYISLLGAGTEGTSTYITATTANDATYTDLGHELELVTLNDDGTIKSTQKYSGNNLIISHANGSARFDITAKTIGGVYKLRLYTKDSYDNDKKEYTTYRDILITVSDGTSEATAYLIGSLKDFVGMGTTSSEGKYYRLSSDIDLSALGTTEWTNNVRTFAGHLNGAMVINNLSAGTVITKRYALTNFVINNAYHQTVDPNQTFGLFNSISNKAAIKNVIFDNVALSIELYKNNTTSNVYAGIIAGINNGKIENCTINLADSIVRLKKQQGEDGADASAQTVNYNIGVLFGENAGAIAYDNTKTGSEYAYMMDIKRAGKLTVVAEAGNTLLNTANINIGGIVGKNANTISSTYEDLSATSLRSMITGVVDLEFLSEYDNTCAPMTINSNIGGAIGYNAGSVEKVAISGSIKANDKINIGGVIGYNDGTISECANYGMTLEAYSLNEIIANKTSESLIYHGAEATQEQNVGGIIGYNNSVQSIKTVRTAFVLFEDSEVSVSPRKTYIKGLGNVGGIIGKTNVTATLYLANIENFVNDEEDYNIIGINSNVAGFVASGSFMSYGSFVQADFNVGTSKFYEFGVGIVENKFGHIYFVGDVLVDVSKLNTDKTGLKDHNAIEAGKSYIVNNVVYKDGLNEVRVVDKMGVTEANGEAVYNALKVKWSTGEGINGDYPYIISIVDVNLDPSIEDLKEVPTLTIQPTEIYVSVDQDYFNETDTVDFARYIKGTGNAEDSGIYVQYTADTKGTVDTSDDTIKATAIVYYDVEGDNIYDLVTDDGEFDLLEMAILPTLANGSYSVNIVSGASIANLISGGTQIQFKGTGRVEIKFVSIYNREVVDTVVIFVENPLHNQTFDLTSSSDLAKVGNSFTTSVGKNSTLSVDVKQVNGTTFDNTKLYMTSEIGLVKAIKGDGAEEEVAVEDYCKYFDFKANTKEISAGKYPVGAFGLTTADLNKDIAKVEVTINISLWLNLKQYLINGKTLAELSDKDGGLLDSDSILITIYNKATALTVTGNVKTEAGTGVDIIANLITGYKGDKVSGWTAIDYRYTSLDEGQTSVLNLMSSEHDVIQARLTAENQNAKDLIDKARLEAEGAGKNFNLWNIFETPIAVTYKTNDDDTGYFYRINMRLKEEYRALRLEEYNDNFWLFNVKVIAQSNRELSAVSQVSFVPEPLTTFRIENYSNLVAKTGSDNHSVTAEFISSETESSMIIPGRSGLVKIFAESSYAYFDNIAITSSSVNIDGQVYFVRFQQMVYDRASKVYRSYAGNTAQGATLPLKAVSYINADGSYEYDGVIFVRTILDNIVGVRKTFTFTVNADSYDIDGKVASIVREKTVLSQYMPGVYINVNNALENNYKGDKVYLVEKGSGNVEVVARVYGYEFNVEPNANIRDKDGKEVPRTLVSLKRSDITQDTDGAYIITYTLGVAGTINDMFKLNLNMSLIENGNTLVAESSALTFYPVEYIINDVHMVGEANNSLNVSINSSKTIDMVWTTNTSTKKSEEINKKLLALDGYLDLFYIKAYNESGRVYDKTFQTLLNAKGDNVKFAIKQNSDKTYRIEGIAKNSTTVYLDVWYKYDLTTGEVSFSTEYSSEFNNKISHQFTLNIVVKTEENAPQPIYSAEEFMAMSEGENYILMDDLTFDDWTPISTAISSLDGNGKLITIKSFDIAVTANVNVGLFSIISEDTILKNVAVNVALLEDNGDPIYINDQNFASGVTVNFGLLAGINNGLIYNCEIVSIGNDKNILIELGAGYKMTFGSLVGVNNGNITNSRVGSEYFDALTLSADNSAISTIKRCGNISIKSKGIMGGFAGANGSSAIISSCYVANSSFENTSNASIDNNKTGGFVAINAGTIAYSYSKGVESTVLDTNARTTAGKVFASGLGSVAGFAFENTGIIHDCYSNIICQSSSAVAAGFVYDSSSADSEIYQCYSASTVKSDATDVALVTELPFVGVGIEKDNAQQLLASKGFADCYYLDDGSAEYDQNYYVPTDVMEPTAVSLEGFSSPDILNNFSFITSGSQDQQLNAVWTYSTAIDKNKRVYYLGSTSLPELTSANKISRSVRKNEVDEHGLLKSNNYANGYELGSAINPYIIRNAEEYDKVFNEGVETSKHKLAGNVRFINNISFKIDTNNYVDISTRSDYKLGDTTNTTFTVIDGNGMTLSDVVINFSKDDKGAIGLFSEIHYALVKGLNVVYANKSSTAGDEDASASTTATYTGGLAGKAVNTYFIDIKLEGGIMLRAHNVVGGVVGQLEGQQSGLYNIESNLSVKAGATGSDGELEYAYDVDNSKLSYAGGIVGIVDNHNAMREVRLNKVDVTGIIVEGQRAGGIAGYLGSNVVANRLSNWITADSQVLGIAVAGGLVAENRANISLSQVGMDIDIQYEYDKAFGDYINSDTLDSIYIDNGTIGIDDENNFSDVYGNLSAVSSQNIAGGFIGINTLGNIDNSLTKANIGPTKSWGIPKVAGGFVGKMVGGSVQTAYAQNFIYLTDTDSKANHELKVGGFAGLISKSTGAVGINEFVSAMWLDKMQLIDIVANNKTGITVDYLAGEIETGVDFSAGTSGSEGTQANINYGQYESFKYEPKETDKYSNAIDNIYSIVTNKMSNKGATPYKLKNLYNMSVADQKEIFESLFITWQTAYWDLDNTRFMPNLRTENDTTFIEIKVEKDIEQFSKHPDGNFILLNDISLTETYTNYVVNTEFTGTLVGKLQEGGNYPKFKAIKLNPKADDNGAGFFKQTTGVRIANVGFEYNSISLPELDSGFTVGGVTRADRPHAQDGGGEIASRFEHVEVAQASGAKGTGITSTAASAKIVGSIIGEATRSTVIGCSSSLKYNINVVSDSAIGGLIGTINGAGEPDIDGVISYDGLISASVYNGEMTITSKSGSTIGGIVGKAQYTNIPASNVYALESDEQKTQKALTLTVNTVNVDGGESSNNVIGGIIGHADNALANNSGAWLTINDIYNDDSYTKESSIQYQIGGIMGLTTNVANDAVVDIKDCYATLSCNISKANDVYLGGLVGIINKYITINSSVSNLQIADNIKGADGEPIDEKDPAINYLTIGGIVARADKLDGVAAARADVEEITTITDTVAYLNMCYAYYAHRFVGGGIIGETYNGYKIVNTMSAGQLFAENAVDTPTDATLTIMGGFIGFAGTEYLIDTTIGGDPLQNQMLEESYTILTMSRAGVYKGSTGAGTPDDPEKKHEVYTDAFVGKVPVAGSISIKNVLYSSDYCLTFAGNDKGYNQNVDLENVGKYQNVTANILINNARYISANAENNEVRGMLTDNNWMLRADAVPIPRSADNLLQKVFIKNNEDKFIIGSAFMPYNVTAWTDEVPKNTDNYTYYSFVGEPDSFGENKWAKLNGVFLGNNRKLTLKTTPFSEIAKHSAVTNLQITLDSSFSEGEGCGVASTNNGTIFMCGVRYNISKAPTTGMYGLVNENNGLVSYCFNGGVIVEVTTGSCSGLINKNSERASVEFSYFTGGVGAVKSDSAALIYTNEGNVNDCYTAGQAGKGVIANMQDNARYSNNYFDMYATYVLSKEYAGGAEAKAGYGDGKIKAIETSELQAISDNEDIIDINNLASELLGPNWSVYNMLNVAKGLTETTYNYGYPIHNIDQCVGYNGIVSDIDKNAKVTGNGTFNKLDVTVKDDAISACKGRLVEQTSKDTTYYDNSAYLINNLGVLNEINTLTTDESQHYSNGKYFELETRIVIPSDYTDYVGYDGLLGNWNGIDKFEGIFSVSGTGEMDENAKTYINDIDFDEDINIEFKQEGEIYIENLRGGALFSSVNTCVISDVILKSSKTKTSTLIDIVNQGAKVGIIRSGIKDAVDAYDITNDKTIIAGLINKTLETSNVYLADAVYGEIKFNAGDELTKDGSPMKSAVAGVIGTNNGTIVVDGGFGGKSAFAEAEPEIEPVAEPAGENSSITVQTNRITGVSAFVGENNGSIMFKSMSRQEDGSATIALNIKNGYEGAEIATVDYVNGFVHTNIGTIEAGSISISITNEETPLDFIKNMSGFVGKMEGGSITAPLTIKISKTRLYHASNNSAGTFAGLVGEMFDGSISQATVTLDSDMEVGVFGGAVAYMQGGTLGGEAEGVSISVDDNTYCYTFGGIVAEYAGGKIDGVKLSSSTELKVGIDETADKGEGIRDSANAYAYGLIIGHGREAKEVDYSQDNTINFTIDGIETFTVNQNAGTCEHELSSGAGIIMGRLSASLGFTFTCEKPEAITLKAEGNAGGFAGIVTNNPTITLDGKDGEGADLWPLYSKEDASSEEAGYAVIEVNAPANNEQVSSMYNFGGLFGYIQKTSPDKDSITFEFTAKVEGLVVTNANKVIHEASSIEAIAKYTDGKSKIENIGGVVGKLVGNMSSAYNNAQVGCGPKKETVGTYSVDGSHSGANPIHYGVMNEVKCEVFKLNNVGGVVGKLSQGTIENCANLTDAEVYGQQYVGGLVGFAEGEGDYSPEIMLSTTQASGGTVTGLEYVGGVLGAAFGNVNIEKGSCMATVYGVAHVGGIIGYITGSYDDTSTPNYSSRVLNVAYQGTVTGNLNVGAIAGYAKIVQIGDDSSSVNIGKDTTVCGSMFDKVHFIDLNGDENDKYVYTPYLPTNIGGAVGFADSTNHGNEQYTGNKFYINNSAYVCTEDKFSAYTLLDEKTNNLIMEKGFATIHMIRNYVATKHEKDGDGVLKAYTFDSTSSTTLVDSMNSGIGGYVGKMGRGNILSGTATADVYAPLGANVGGLIGYFDGGIDYQNNPFENLIIGTTDDPINVAGRAYIGGYIGKINGEINRLNKTPNPDTNEMEETGYCDAGDPFVNTDKSPDGLAYINVQRYNKKKAGLVGVAEDDMGSLYGMYIGGVVGYTTSNIIGIQLGRDSVTNPTTQDSGQTTFVDSSIPSGIKIYNQAEGVESDNTIGTSYVGTIVGRIDTDGASSDGADIRACTVSHTASGMYVEELKPVKDGKDESPFITVDGHQKVNTSWYPTYEEVWGTKYLPNANLQSADTNVFNPSLDNYRGIIVEPRAFNYGGIAGVVRGSNAYINATHYYAFTVDSVRSLGFATDDPSLDYDDEDGAIITAVAHYSANSSINIKASQLDSLYDGYYDYNPTQTNARGWAKEYTMFRVLYREQEQLNYPTGNAISELYSADCITEVGNDITIENKKPVSEDIQYTIYAPYGGLAKLYCKRGIASGFDIDSYKATFAALPSDQIGELGGLNETTGLPYFYRSITSFGDSNSIYSHAEPKSNSDLGNFMYWNTNDKKDSEEGVTTVDDRYYYTLGYTYFNIQDVGAPYFQALNDDGINEDNRTYNNLGDKDTYFKFDVVYDNYKSTSGSLFEANGSQKTPQYVGMEVEKGWWDSWGKNVFVTVLVVAATVAAVFTGGASLAGLLAGLGMKAGSALLMFGGLGVGLLIVPGAAGSLVGIIAISICNALSNANAISLDMTNNISKAIASVEAVLSERYEKSMGLQHIVYSRSIEISNGQLVPNSDELISYPVEIELNYDQLTAYIWNVFRPAMSEEDKIDIELLLGGLKVDNGIAYYPISLPYIYYCNENALPSDYSDSIPLKVKDLGTIDVKAETKDYYHPIFEYLEDGYTKDVPKYIKRNSEIYMCVADIGASTYKMLYKNYLELTSEWDDDKEAGLIINNGSGYAYMYDNGSEIQGLCKSDAVAEYLASEYGINNTMQHPVNYELSNTAPANTLGSQAITEENTSWKVEITEPSGTSIEVAVNKYDSGLDSVKWENYTNIFHDGARYVPAGTEVKKTDGSVLAGATNTTIYFVADSDGAFATSLVGGFVSNLTGNYSLVKDDNGLVTISHTYYLFYPDFEETDKPIAAGKEEIHATITYGGTVKVTSTLLTDDNKEGFTDRYYYQYSNGQLVEAGEDASSATIDADNPYYVAVIPDEPQDEPQGQYHIQTDFLNDPKVYDALKNCTIVSGFGAGRTIGETFEVNSSNYSLGSEYFEDTAQSGLTFYYKPVIARVSATVDAGYNYNKKYYKLYEREEGEIQEGDSFISFYTRYDYDSGFMKIELDTMYVNNLLYRGDVSLAQNVITTINERVVVGEETIVVKHINLIN